MTFECVPFIVFAKYYLNCSLSCNLGTNAINISNKAKSSGNSYSTRKLANVNFLRLHRDAKFFGKLYQMGNA